MSEQTKREVLRDLETRLDSAVRNLDLLCREAEGQEFHRLSGKRQGVRLALSYVQEVDR